MSDYQAIYDAVRSRLSNCDIGLAVSSAIEQIGLGHYANQIKNEIGEVVQNYNRPSVFYRPKLVLWKRKVPMWCAIYGDNEVIGRGRSPAEAMADFDNEWYKIAKEGEADV